MISKNTFFALILLGLSKATQNGIHSESLRLHHHQKHNYQAFEEDNHNKFERIFAAQLNNKRHQQIKNDYPKYFTQEPFILSDRKPIEIIIDQETYPSVDSHSTLQPYRQRDNAWTEEQSKNTNERQWKADSPPHSLAQEMTIAEALNKYRVVDSYSHWLPYVVRDHAWNYDELYRSNLYRFLDNSPTGYSEQFDFDNMYPQRQKPIVKEIQPELKPLVVPWTPGPDDYATGNYTKKSTDEKVKDDGIQWYIGKNTNKSLIINQTLNLNSSITLNNSLQLNKQANQSILIPQVSKDKQNQTIKLALANKKIESKVKDNEKAPCAPAGANCPNPSGPVLYKAEDFLPQNATLDKKAPSLYDLVKNPLHSDKTNAKALGVNQTKAETKKPSKLIKTSKSIDKNLTIKGDQKKLAKTNSTKTKEEKNASKLQKQELKKYQNISAELQKIKPKKKVVNQTKAILPPINNKFKKIA